MSLRHYTLDEKGEPKLIPVNYDSKTGESSAGFWRWASEVERLRENGLFRVAESCVGHEVSVSTVFLHLDHNFSGQGPPILWETMTFGGPLDQQMIRCGGSREQAEKMHEEMIERVKAVLALSE